MTTSSVNSREVAELERLVEEATRSSEEGVRRFIEPAGGTLARATSRQHHLVFGRRGSGKSSLLRKAAADLTVDRRPIAFVDLETFKGHAYPDVLLSVLVETFSEFATWLTTAAVAPANKKSFWSKLFGRKPSRPPFDKKSAQTLAEELCQSVAALRSLLYSEDDAPIEVTRTGVSSHADEVSATGGLKTSVATAGGSLKSTVKTDASESVKEEFKRAKLNHLHRHIIDYQGLFKRMASLSDGDAFLFLDDLYHIRRSDQAQVIDYFHRIAKGHRLWIKIGTIRHRSQWYIHGDPPMGTKIGDDIDEIDLDLTLEKYGLTRAFLSRILDAFLGEAKVRREDMLTDGALDRLVLASGGVARDFLGILRRAIIRARERGDTSRGDKVGVEDVNGAAGEYDSAKREELSRDTLDESEKLEAEFASIRRFAKNYSKANVFLLDKELPEVVVQPIAELVDLRLLHKVRARVTVADRPGKIYEAYMLDVSQYTAARKMRGFEIVEFWRTDAADAIRRPGLIYKEYVGRTVVTKDVPEDE